MCKQESPVLRYSAICTSQDGYSEERSEVKISYYQESCAVSVVLASGSCVSNMLGK